MQRYKWVRNPDFINSIGYARKHPYLEVLDDLAYDDQHEGSSVYKSLKNQANVADFNSFIEGSLANLLSKKFWSKKIRNAKGAAGDFVVGKIKGLVSKAGKYISDNIRENLSGLRISDSTMSGFINSILELMTQQISDSLASRIDIYGKELVDKIESVLSSRLEDEKAKDVNSEQAEVGDFELFLHKIILDGNDVDVKKMVEIVDDQINKIQTKKSKNEVNNKNALTDKVGSFGSYTDPRGCFPQSYAPFGQPLDGWTNNPVSDFLGKKREVGSEQLLYKPSKYQWGCKDERCAKLCDILKDIDLKLPDVLGKTSMTKAEKNTIIQRLVDFCLNEVKFLYNLGKPKVTDKTIEKIDKEVLEGEMLIQVKHDVNEENLSPSDALYDLEARLKVALNNYYECCDT